MTNSPAAAHESWLLRYSPCTLGFSRSNPRKAATFDREQFSDSFPPSPLLLFGPPLLIFTLSVGPPTPPLLFGTGE